MDVLTVSGKKYIKATSIAKNLGYTADYVGQLCRTGKVDAKLVGRSWYVLEDSIHAHKHDRYRTTQTKTIKHVESQIQARNQENQIKLAPSHFYARTLAQKSVSYDTDIAELIPSIDKDIAARSRHVMDIGLADAKQLKIESEKDSLIFEMPTLPKLKFKGTLVVSEFNEDEIALPDGGKVIHPQEKVSFKIVRKAKNKVISPERVVQHIPKEEKGTTHVHPEDLDSGHHVHVAYIHGQDFERKQSFILTYLTYLFLSLCFPIGLSFFVVGSLVSATASSTSSSFFLTFEYLQKIIVSIF